MKKRYARRTVQDMLALGKDFSEGLSTKEAADKYGISQSMAYTYHSQFKKFGVEFILRAGSNKQKSMNRRDYLASQHVYNDGTPQEEAAELAIDKKPTMNRRTSQQKIDMSKDFIAGVPIHDIMKKYGVMRESCIYKTVRKFQKYGQDYYLKSMKERKLIEKENPLEKVISKLTPDQIKTVLEIPRLISNQEEIRKQYNILILDQVRHIAAVRKLEGEYNSLNKRVESINEYLGTPGIFRLFSRYDKSE